MARIFPLLKKKIKLNIRVPTETCFEKAIAIAWHV